MLEFKIEEDVIVEVIVVESQCKRDVVNETRDENMQNVIEKQLQSKETRDENEAAQKSILFLFLFLFFCLFYFI